MANLAALFDVLGLGANLRNSGDSFDFSSELALAWAVADSLCLDCGSAVLLCANNETVETVRDVFTICLGLGHLRGAEKIPLAEAELMQKRLDACLDGMGRLGLNLEFFASALNSAGGLSIALSSEKLQQASSSEVPEGYKSVGWIKLHEAELVIEAERLRSEQVGPGSNPSFRVEYYDPTSVDAKKYHSTTKLVRLRRGEVGRSFWIRKEEAEALVEAWVTSKSIQFAHLNFGNGGLVEFHQAESDVAIRFRSCTRLLRRY